MMKYLGLVSLVLMVGCSSAPHKNSSANSKSSAPGQLDLEVGGGASSDESKSSSNDNESDKSDNEEKVAATPVSKKDTSALEEKFKNAVMGQREDAMIQSGSEILSQRPNDEKILNGFAQFYIRAGYPDLAKIYLTRVTDKDPKNATANNGLGVIAMKENKEADAQAFFKRALQGNDANLEANANLGTFYLKYLDYDKAAVFLQKAYDQDHKNVAVANNYAVALRGLGKYDDAMSIYKSVESKGSKMQVMLNEAILLAEYKKDFKEAKEILNKIRFISSDPVILKKVNVLSSKLSAAKDK